MQQWLCTCQKRYFVQSASLFNRPIQALQGEIKFHSFFIFQLFDEKGTAGPRFLSLGVEIPKLPSSEVWYDIRVSYGTQFVVRKPKNKKNSAKKTLKIIKPESVGLQIAREVMAAKAKMRLELKNKRVSNLKNGS